MIQLKESIHVSAPVRTVFNYVSDFSHIQEWDPGVVFSKKALPGETGRGSVYDLTLAFGPFRPKMQYTVTAYQPLAKVVLEGSAETFSATDTILFTHTPTGTRIDYQADIRFSGTFRYFERWLSPILKKAGKKAMLGLARELCRKTGSDRWIDHDCRWVDSGSGVLDYLADHAVVPGMFMFSRFGYALSRRFWAEPKTTLYGKQVVVTGGTSGIGRAAAYELARKKAVLTIIARNRQKADQVRQDIIEQTGNPNVQVLVGDLSLMTDIRTVVGQLQETQKPIDILINNAGALFNERTETPEGIEKTFATDLFGVFCLTMGLAPLLAASRQGARIINVSSGGMYTQKIDVDDLENRNGPYNGAKAYARAKRGIVILTRFWAEKFRSQGIRVHAMHPGWVDTPGIQRSLPGFHSGLKPILRTPEQGADTIVWLALSEQGGQSTGRFWMDRRPHETVIFPGTGESERDRQVLWEKLNQRFSG